MISIKETATVRLEIEFELLVGELRVLEDDFEKMPLKQFMDVWGPEMIGIKVMLHLIDSKKEE